MTDLQWGAPRQPSFFLPSWHSPNLPPAPLKADPYLSSSLQGGEYVGLEKRGSRTKIGRLALISKRVPETWPSLLPLREPVLLGGTAVPPRPGSPSYGKGTEGSGHGQSPCYVCARATCARPQSPCGLSCMRPILYNKIAFIFIETMFYYEVNFFLYFVSLCCYSCFLLHK